MICVCPSRLVRRLLPVLAWGLVLLSPSSVQAAETVALVLPGTDGVTVPLESGIYAVLHPGPLHGTVEVTQTTAHYVPSDSFWHLGNDTVVLLSRFSTEPLRIRFVAGVTDTAGYITRIAPPEGPSHAWQVSGDGVEQVQVDPTTPGFRFSLDQATAAAVTTPDSGTGGPDNSTTTSDIRVVIDDIHEYDGPTVESRLATWGPMEIYRVTTHGGADLWVELGVDHQTGDLGVRPVSNLDQSAPFAPLLDGSSLRLVRGRQGVNGFASLQVDNGPPETIPTATGPRMFEHHELLVSYLSLPGVGVTFEEPVVRMGDGWTESATWVSSLDFEDPGLSGWTSGGAVGAWSLSDNQQVGSGDTRLEVDLDLVPDGQWVYLKSPELAGDVPLLDSMPGFGLRFWYDDSQVQMPPQGGRVGLVAICPDGPWCGALRLRLEHVDGQRWLVASAKRDGTSSTPLWTPVAPGAHLVEARLQNSSRADMPNGWIDLWIDGAYAGRIPGLINHGQVSEYINVGALGVDGEVGGVLQFDDLEVWRFE